MNAKKIITIIGGIAVVLAAGSAAYVAKHNPQGLKALTTGVKK